MNIYALAANGSGGLNWEAVPMLAAWVGVQDVEGLMHRLAVIRLHRKPETKRT
jgi:hypothetical protein